MFFSRQSRVLRSLAATLSCTLLLAAFFLCVNPPEVQAAPDYYRIVVLGDPHLPYKPKLWNKKARQDRVIATKNKLLEQINAWDDVNLVVAVGDCGCTGGIFGESYASCGRVSNVIPVDVSIPGCPPTPLQLIQGILAALAPGKSDTAG